MIPRIIHQIWFTEDESPLPAILSEMSQSWKHFHEEYELIIWSKDKLYEFISSKFPQALLMLNSYKYDIQRIDALKYYLLLYFGGFYIDLDIECIKSFLPLLREYNCYLSRDSPVDEIIGNCFIAAESNHEFLKFVVEQLPAFSSQVRNENDKINCVLKTTGPGFLSKQYELFNNKKLLNILDSCYVSPITALESREIMNTGEVSLDIEQKLERAYAVHYFFSSWLK